MEKCTPFSNISFLFFFLFYFAVDFNGSHTSLICVCVCESFVVVFSCAKENISFLECKFWLKWIKSDVYINRLKKKRNKSRKSVKQNFEAAAQVAKIYICMWTEQCEDLKNNKNYEINFDWKQYAVFPVFTFNFVSFSVPFRSDWYKTFELSHQAMLVKHPAPNCGNTSKKAFKM